MATSLQILLFSFILTLSIFFCNAQSSIKPRALVLPVSKDASTLQYITHFNQRTPLVSLKLVLDLGGQFFWVDCEHDFVSSTYKPIPCYTQECSKSGTGMCATAYYAPPRPGRNNNTCAVLGSNSETFNYGSGGELSLDTVSLQSTNGRNPGPSVSVPGLVFVCGSTENLKGLASGAKGMAGLGRARYALPLQFAAAFNFFRMKFAVCLPSSTNSKGVVFFGDGPYVMLPNIDISSSQSYTPLYINKVSTATSYFKGQWSTEYFVGIKSIMINDQPIPLNTTLLNIKRGKGGTKISTVDPYTVLETSIYNAFTQAFLTAAKSMKMTAVASVAQFKFCFNSKNIVSTRVGLAVPTIDLVFQSKSVFWRIFGSNSMVQVSKDVVCLGFLDGGSSPTTSIIIGGYQLQDNLIEIDLKKKMLGFSSSLLFKQTTCSNFNFTSTV